MITCHAWWPGANDPFYLANVAENTARINYYGVNSVPHVCIDGLIDAGSGGPWELWMLNRYAVDSPLTITLSGQMFTTTTGEITAEITNTSGAAVSGALHFVLIQNDILYSSKLWQNVMRDFFPGDTSGELISLNPSDVLVRTEAFTIAGGWLRRNMVAIVFVQNDTTKEIYQTGRIFFELDAPELAPSPSFVIDDTATGNGDGYLDQGESAAIILGLANLNPPTATSVAGTLSSVDPYVTIDDASATWPDIPSGQMIENSADPFIVTAAESAPWGYQISVTLLANAQPGGYGKSMLLSIPVGAPNNPIGPDAHGYYAYEDCDDYVPSPTFDWVEIDPNHGGSGTQLVLADDETLGYDLPFTFTYYGEDFTHVSICSNGWVMFGTTTGSANGNGRIPGTEGPPNMMAAFWTDLDPSAAGSGKVYRYSDTANHRVVIEYSGVEHFDDNGLGLPETFEYILYDPAYYPTPTGDGEIVMQYALVSDAGTCTVGIENGTELIGIEYAAFGELNAAASGLVANRAVKYTTVLPSSAAVDENPNASQATLLRAGPNPARGATQISYDLPAAGDVTLRVFSLEGALVRTLLSGHVAAGPGVVEWDGRSDRGRDVPAGVYFYRLSGPGFEVSRKIVKQE